LSQVSSYLRYLPPVLWRDEPPPPAFSLGAALCVFEKILTGIDDGVVVSHGGHAHDAIQTVIARAFRLFDPWTTPPQFLDWLASWVGLTFPDLWDEYQRRKVVAEAVRIYRQRGLKAGLNQFLDVYTVADHRPRIAIDDCCKVLFTRPQPNRFAPIYALLSQNEVTLDPVKGVPTKVTGMIAPICLGRGPDGSLFVGDEGTPEPSTPTVPAGVWQLPPPENFFRFPGAPPAPARVGPPVWPLAFPVAVATDGASPWNLYVLDYPPAQGLGGGGSQALYQLGSPSFPAAAPLATVAKLGLVWPVDMVFDAPNNALLILDRGADPYSASPPQPKVIVVTGLPAGPVTVTPHAINGVLEPLALVILSGGNLVVTDARDQTFVGPADLMLVDRANAWAVSSLLGAVAAGQNPLVAPTALARLDDAHFYVVDVGLKALRATAANPYVRLIANPATVYRIDLGAAPPSVVRAAEFGQLVFPTGMVLGGDTLYIADQGDYALDETFSPALYRVWRARVNEFGVLVHFADTRTLAQRRRILEDVREIIDQERPAHTYWTMLGP